MSTSPFDTTEQLDDSHDFVVRRDSMTRAGYRCRRLVDARGGGGTPKDARREGR